MHIGSASKAALHPSKIGSTRRIPTAYVLIKGGGTTKHISLKQKEKQ
jgi:hypothetical protein